jgi:hypothetical protein
MRHINRPAPVPKLPTISLIANHYGHCGAETLLGAALAAAGEATEEAAATFDLFKQMALKVVDGVLNAALIEELWAAITQRIDAHSMTNYRSLVAALCPHERTEGKAKES